MMIQLPVYRTGEGLQSVSSQILRILTDFFSCEMDADDYTMYIRFISMNCFVYT